MIEYRSNYCYLCAERRELRLFEIVNRFGLRLVPFCQRCARSCGKQWDTSDVAVKNETAVINDPRGAV